MYYHIIYNIRRYFIRLKVELIVEKYDISCFIDTNIFLHYQMFTEIDWNELTHKRSVLLVICSTVLSELDKKKDLDPDINVRNRARRVVAKLSELEGRENVCDNIHKLKDNVDILFIPYETNFNWENQNLEVLDKNINDDRIIASILTNAHLNNPVLVTSDLGFKLKAKGRNIKYISMPPDKYRIEIIKDSKDKEINKLKEKIEYLKNRIPRLKMGFSNGKKDYIDHVEKVINAINILSEEDIAKRVQIEKANLEYKKDDPSNFLDEKSPIGAMLRYPEKEIQRYKKDLDEYILNLYKYYKEENTYKCNKSRTVKLGFVLINEGTQPAKDVEIFVYFPDDFELFKNNEFQKKPLKPKKPIQPRNQLDMMQSSIKNALNSPNSQRSIDIKELWRSIDNVDIGEPIGPIIKKTTEGYEVIYTINKLKHGIHISLNPIYVLFKTIDSAKSFKVEYIILSDNIPDSIRGSLNVKITKNVSKK